ncbi:MAG: bifunctional DNA primase/polymerase [Phycisphaerae bacterium]|nr:bifunctional DNA primase/polymerase [Phycisphaerae bacterium]
MVAENDGQEAQSPDVRVDEARAAFDRGWCLTPLDGKRPRLKGWQSLHRPIRPLIESWARSGNVGVRTGQPSGVIVLDVDAPTLPPELASIVTPTVRTGKGGLHLYFAAPPQPVRNSVKAIHPTIDIRGDGGQVVLAGGIHPETGRRYEWPPGRSPTDIAFAPFDALPEGWRARMLASQPSPRADSVRPPEPDADRPARTATPRALAALTGEAETVVRAAEGERNHTLNRAAFNLGTLIGAGELARDDAEHALAGAARVCGLPDDEAQATIRSGLDAGEKHPRPPSDRCNGAHNGDAPRAPDRAKALDLLHRALPGVPVVRIVKRGGDRADFDLLTTDGRAVQLGDAKAVLDPTRVQAAIADVLGIVIRPRVRKDWRPIAQALFDLAEPSDEGDTEANQTRGWLAVLGGGADARRVDLTDSTALARYLHDRCPPIVRASDQRLYAHVYGVADALRRDMALLIGERELRRRLTRLGFEAHQLSARSDEPRFKGRVLKGRFLRSPVGFDAEEAPL